MDSNKVLPCLEVGEKNGCWHPSRLQEPQASWRTAAIMVVSHSFLNNNYDICLSVIIAAEIDKVICSGPSGLPRTVLEELLKLTFFLLIAFPCQGSQQQQK